MQNCSNKKAFTGSTASTIISSSPVTITSCIASPVTLTTTDSCDALLNDPVQCQQSVEFATLFQVLFKKRKQH